MSSKNKLTQPLLDNKKTQKVISSKTPTQSGGKETLLSSDILAQKANGYRLAAYNAEQRENSKLQVKTKK